jgi:hypothetical protein
MKGPGLLAVSVLVFNNSAFAQVSSGTQPSTQQIVESNPPPPKPPTYTPEQLLGSPAPSSTSSTDRPLVPQPLPPGPNTEAATPAGRTSSCPAPSPTPATTSHPGVSASQFKRAGVSAEAFTRPGVSAEQLNALRPGARSNPCAPPRTTFLYPEPFTPSPRFPVPADQP